MVQKTLEGKLSSPAIGKAPNNALKLIIKLFMDGGHGSFKLCLSVFSHISEYEYHSGRSTYNDHGDESKLTVLKGL